MVENETNSSSRSPKTQVSSLDGSRFEEPWTRKGEELILAWSKEIKRAKDLHDDSGYYYKNMRKRWGLPAIIIPAVMAPVSSVFFRNKLDKVCKYGCFCCSCNNGWNRFVL